MHTDPDQALISDPVGRESAEKPAARNAEIEQRGEPGGGIGPHTAVLHQIAAGPETGRLFQRTVGEKGHEYQRHPPDAQRLPQAKRPSGTLFLSACRPSLLPKRQTDKENGRQGNLYETDDAVSAVPTISARQAGPHDIGAGRGADTPETMQPAHVAGREMQGHIVVQRSIDRPGTQPVGNGP